jgi:hypothetical protein
MARFSAYFQLNASQQQLDFVDVDTEKDLEVYVDPYAIEVQDDLWSSNASEHIRVFFKEVLQALADGDRLRADDLMSKLHEPKETFLGVSKGKPKGRGVGSGQSQQLIRAIIGSKAYASGLLSDLSEMALYVENIDKDKVSDLTTNVIRHCLVDYTCEQCRIYGIETKQYIGPPLFDVARKNWISRSVNLPFIENEPVILVPKHIVRRGLSINSQEFYNKQITTFLVAEHTKAVSSLVRVIKGKQKVFKTEVRKAHPKSKNMIADFVAEHPEVLALYKSLATKSSYPKTFFENDPTPTSVYSALAEALPKIPTGAKYATEYEKLIVGCLIALFHPELIQPHNQWEINGGRKRIDIVFTNRSTDGFFSARRDNHRENAQVVIVECKNYSNDLANPELDQLIGRFDDRRGKFGFLVCRSIDDPDTLKKRILDAAKSNQAYIIVLTDSDIISMLIAKANLQDDLVEKRLYSRYRELLE